MLCRPGGNTCCLSDMHTPLSSWSAFYLELAVTSLEWLAFSSPTLRPPPPTLPPTKFAPCWHHQPALTSVATLPPTPLCQSTLGQRRQIITPCVSPLNGRCFFSPSSGRLPALRHRARKGDCRLAGHPIIFRAASPAEVRPVRSFQALLIGGDGNRGERPDSGACLPVAWALDPSSSAGQIQIDWMWPKNKEV